MRESAVFGKSGASWADRTGSGWFSGKGCRMKGVAVSAQLMLILTLVFLGTMILLGTSTSSTPVYYKNLAESKFADLLMKYELIKSNIRDSLEGESSRMFSAMGDYPIEWSTVESAAPSDDEWSILYKEKLSSAAQGYLNSASNSDFEWIEISEKESTVTYDSSGPKVEWHYKYNINIQNVIPDEDIANKINSEEEVSITYDDFLNLDGAWHCAKDYFAKSASSEGAFYFTEMSDYFLNQGLGQKLNQIKPDSCSGFKTTMSVFNGISCPGGTCRQSQMKPVGIILLIEPSGSGRGAVSFIHRYSNFAAGSPSASGATGQPCSLGSECGTLDCVGEVCGKCLEAFENSLCSPSGTGHPPATHRCYRVLSGSGSYEYRCLQNKASIGLTDGTRWFLSGQSIKVNCALEDGRFEVGVSGATSDTISVSKVLFNGVEVSSGTQKIELCDTDEVPPVNGRIEVYLEEGGDAYRAFETGVRFALSECEDEVSSKLGEYVYSFGESDYEELRRGIETAVRDVARGASCEGYRVYVSEVMFSCGSDISACSGTTTWDREKYSPVTVEFEDESTGNVAFRSTYIISYSP
ncbi:MAG: hypothetical protein JW727_02875 [Candidatus Aenigmarchaeota archaeon]|nr:hypothetical protein [Candidatus Aenigmarchaeota archaeon]